MALAETFTNEQLFAKGIYAWVGGQHAGILFHQLYVQPLRLGDEEAESPYQKLQGLIFPCGMQLCRL